MAQRRLSRVGVSAFHTPHLAKARGLAPVLAKTSRPQLADVYVRAQLFDMLDLACRRLAATLVSGPPGAGKTTLVASYLEARQLGSVWYQLDPGADDVATFFHYFGEALKLQGVEEAPVLPAFEPGTATDLARFSRRYFRALFAISGVPAVIVLDNYDELPPASAMHEVVRVACQEVPAGHHIVIIGRGQCPESLSRTRLNQRLMTIDADDLALTLEETRGLARMRGVELASAAAALSLHVRSAGWIMGLMLMLESMRRNAGDASGLGLQQGQEELLFAYFAGEVLKTFDDASRTALMQMALLPKMTPERVSRLTGTPKAGLLLRELVRANCFVMRRGSRDGAYEFHPLFREFLLGEARRSLGTSLPPLLSQAAEALMADGEDEAAVELLEQAGDFKRMCEVVLALAPVLKAQGRDATLSAWLQKLPRHVIDGATWLRFWEASSLTASDPEASQPIFEDAYRRFEAVGDFVGIAFSWFGVMDAILRMHRDLRQTDAWVAEFDAHLAGRVEQLPPDLAAHVTLAYFNALTFRQPLHPAMPLWLEKVRARFASERRAEERAMLRLQLVRYHLLRGEHAEPQALVGIVHPGAASAEDGRAVALMDRVSEAWVALHLGNADRCLHAVNAGLRSAEESGDRLSQAVLLQIGAAMSLNRGEHAVTDGYLAAFERLVETLPFVDNGGYYAVCAWRRYQRGEAAMAIHLLRRATAASQARGTDYFVAVDRLGLGLLLQLCHEPEEAREQLEIGHRIGAAIGNALIVFAYHLFSAHLLLETREQEKVSHHLARAMHIGREHGYMHFYYFPPKPVARLCLEALERGIEPQYVCALIRHNGLTPDPAWRQSESWPWPIRIYTLGRFSVVKDGQTIRSTGKTQKKPMELLKLLIALGGREVTESRLADTLWPDAEGDAAAQAFATTLFRLRKLLGEQAIRRQEGRVTLDPGVCWVDCWEFERVSTDASLDPATRLARLERLYHGPFLDGTDAEPWVQPLRQRLQAKIARIARDLPALIPWYLTDILSLLGGA